MTIMEAGYVKLTPIRGPDGIQLLQLTGPDQFDAPVGLVRLNTVEARKIGRAMLDWGIKRGKTELAVSPGRPYRYRVDQLEGAMLDGGGTTYDGRAIVLAILALTERVHAVAEAIELSEWISP